MWECGSTVRGAGSVRRKLFDAVRVGAASVGVGVRRRRAPWRCACRACLSLGLSGCADRIGTPESASTATVVVGAPAEPDAATGAVLAEIYAGVLARAGTEVRTDPDAGARADYLAGLDADRLTLVPEQSVALLNHLDPAAALADEDAAYVLLEQVAARGSVGVGPGVG